MKYALLFWFFLLSFALFAQDEEVLFNKVIVQGGFGGPIFELTNIDNQTGMMFGGGGGVILNDFFIGGFGQGGSFAEHTVDSRLYPLNMGYGGLWLGYVRPTWKAVHLFADLKVAGGSISLSQSRDDEASEVFDDNIFVVQPGAGAEVNVFGWFRVALTAHYRLVSGISNGHTFGLGNADFNAPAMALTLRFGGFYRGSGD